MPLMLYGLPMNLFHKIKEYQQQLRERIDMSDMKDNFQLLAAYKLVWWELNQIVEKHLDEDKNRAIVPSIDTDAVKKELKQLIDFYERFTNRTN